MILNDTGKIASDEWARTALIRKEIEIGDFIVMPNHFHGIVFIKGLGDRLISTPATYTGEIMGDQPVAPTKIKPGPKPKSISSFLAGFKSICTKRINEFRQSPGVPVWQRNYYEHIIRDENELNHICEYIMSNPANWRDDENNPDMLGIMCRGDRRSPI